MRTRSAAATAGGTGLWFHETGPLDTVPILFLHPSGANAGTWDAHLDRLIDHHCVAIDLPGHRYSQTVPWESLEATADQVADFIAGHLGGRAHVIGLSLGGSVALRLMARHPDRLDHVIVDGAAALPSRTAWLLEAGVSVVSSWLHTRAVSRALAAGLGIPRDSQEAETFAAGLRAIPPRVFRRAFCQAQRVRMPPDPAAITAPVLLVAGERDPRTTRISNATLARTLPRAEARFVPGVGHAWMTKHPDEHVAMVGAWIADQPLPDLLEVESTPPVRAD
jgi:pimeloyl-ACP methyl ester carboxylesterase